jgi:hypothetical protein
MWQLFGNFQILLWVIKKVSDYYVSALLLINNQTVSGSPVNYLSIVVVVPFQMKPFSRQTLHVTSQTPSGHGFWSESASLVRATFWTMSRSSQLHGNP